MKSHYEYIHYDHDTDNWKFDTFQLACADEKVVKHEHQKKSWVPVVIEVPGYLSTERRELERRMKAEERIAKEQGYELAGKFLMPVKWPIERPIWRAPMGRRDVKIIDLGKRILVRRWIHKFNSL